MDGVCQCSTAVWDRWARCDCSILHPKQNSLLFQLWRLLAPSRVSHSSTRPTLLLDLRTTSFIPSPEVSAVFTPPSCPPIIHPSCFLYAHQQAVFGLVSVASLPHCVPPDASDRTRCLLMASSRNPATFSLSSCEDKIKKQPLQLFPSTE